MISPFPRHDYIDHDVSDQSSILNMIEYNWGLSPIAGSADQLLAGTDQAEHVKFDLAGLFRFHGARSAKLLLNPGTGQPIGH